ncbi:MAG TPA: hypothetical protein VEK38_00275 [Candidatus Bathyarchaeia archaeon]|nr:hypothetical protein [Candidatus Bathyarchaeia archaeon]
MNMYRIFLLTAVLSGGIFSVHNSFASLQSSLPSFETIKRVAGPSFAALFGFCSGFRLIEDLSKKISIYPEKNNRIIPGFVTAGFGVLSGAVIYAIQDPEIRKQAIKNALIAAGAGFALLPASTLVLLAYHE